ncbi:protein PHLOEM PROTEIN 2-LIKE A1-like isoform X2 [Camellia sinensis]|uniref:protein PHLOEM PROTEIN 2-LIKE A1-like isoform X2 n=1 Tax=Camellia sinensis TaxID=4442 RepID=UPI001036D77F|nr:protein PHLOEM PROTEIN 2-LIKE A1-like isoform X2 [Camellia sinensis]
MSSPDKLCEQLYSGVYLKPNKLKYFVDKKSNKNCFVLFARDLNICWNDNPQYWRWITLKEARFNIYPVWHAVVKRLKSLSYYRYLG